MHKIIDGKLISNEIKNEVKGKVSKLKTNNIFPTLAVILVGDDKSSKIYVKNKQKACEFTGIKSLTYNLESNVSELELLSLIKKLNEDVSVHGILVQLPLPNHINSNKVLLSIKPEKDVDGFHPYNVGLLSIGSCMLKPCTPSGIIELIKRYNILIESKNCVVIGRSNIVGKPMAQLLLQENATVTICHSKTTNLKEQCLNADILVTAIGKPKLITFDMVKENGVIIDVGMNRDDNGLLCGDADFENVKNRVSYITPVPGGVGPMTIAQLMQNCVIACESQLLAR